MALERLTRARDRCRSIKAPYYRKLGRHDDSGGKMMGVVTVRLVEGGEENESLMSPSNSDKIMQPYHAKPHPESISNLFMISNLSVGVCPLSLQLRRCLWLDKQIASVAHAPIAFYNCSLTDSALHSMSLKMVMGANPGLYAALSGRHTPLRVVSRRAAIFEPMSNI